MDDDDDDDDDDDVAEDDGEDDEVEDCRRMMGCRTMRLRMMVLRTMIFCRAAGAVRCVVFFPVGRVEPGTFFGNVSSFWLFSWSKCGFEGLGPLKRLEKAR